MPITLMLVVALAGGNWDCQQKDGLWNCQPSAQDPQIVPRASAPTDQAGANRSPPVSSPAVAEQPAQLPAITSTSPPVAKADASPAPARSVANKVASNPPASGATYIVQIGAYRQKSEAEAAARGLEYESLAIMPTRRGEETWFVLLLGAFTGLEQARAAGDAYVKAHPGGSYWVRTDRQLQEVLRPDSQGRFPAVTQG